MYIKAITICNGLKKFIIPIGLILWVIFSSDLFAQNKPFRFEHLTVNDGLSQNTVNGIVKDKYGFMWFGTWEGLCRYDGYHFKVYWAEIDKSNRLYNNRIRYIYKDKNEVLWISNVGDLFCRYNYESDDFTRVPRNIIPKEIVDSLNRDICKMHKNAISKDSDFKWEINQVNNLQLLVQTNKKTGKRIDYRSDPIDPWALNDEFVFNIYLDNNDILWIGTYSGGINMADIKQKPFHHYYHKYKDSNSIIDNLIRPIFVDNLDNIWVGTFNKGITKIDKNNKYTHFQHNPKNPNSLFNNQVRKIYCDRYGLYWFGTKDGLDQYNPRTGKFVHYAIGSKYSIPHPWIYSIMEDHAGYLWIGTFNGFAKYDRKKDRFLAFDPGTTLKSNRVRVILEDKHNHLWVATEGGGVTCFDRDSTLGFEEKLKPHHYTYDSGNPHSLVDDRVFSMAEDENGFLWIGTAGGVSRLDPSNGKCLRFSAKDGLPDELIIGLVSDRKGSMWLSHKKGLTRIDISNFTMHHFNKDDGLQNNEFSEDSYSRNPRTGEIFFGGVNGFNSFYSDSIKENPYPPQIAFTNLLISETAVPINNPLNGRIILQKSINLTDKIILTYKEKTVTIEFAALHFSNPNGNKYSYMLEGFDKGWTNSDAAKHSVTYSNLEPKTYIFKIKACNSDGVWNRTPRTLTITVLTPWWQTWWFEICSCAVAIFLLLVLFQLRVGYYRNKQKELEQLVKNRTHALEESNELLLERQTRIEEQTEELKSANELLMEKQILIQTQAESLQSTNQQLTILNSTKDKFFSLIAHDLKNPFHVVSGFSQLLLKDLHKLSIDRAVRYIELIHKTSTYGNNLLDNLLQWSRSQTGRISFEPIAIELSIMVEEIMYLLEGEAITKNITMESFIDQGLTITADQNMLNTILRNLTSNAIKFTSKGGKISYRATVSPTLIEISVIDTGIGISAENCRLLFSIHTNISTKGTSNENGTGLGLVLCKEFVEKHNGNIWVESEIGKGSTFKFTLPNV